MNLKFSLSDENLQLCGLADGEEICYCLPLDLTVDGDFQENGYTVITDRRILTLEQGARTHELELERCGRVFGESMIGGGVLIVVQDGLEQLWGRFSGKHMVRYFYMDRAVQLLKEKSSRRVVSREYEKTCPVCGRVLRGTKTCPYCEGRKGGFISFFAGLLKTYWKKTMAILALMLVSSLISVISPAVQRRLVDDVLTAPERRPEQAVFCIALMFLLGFGGVLANVVKNYQCAKLGARVANDQRQKLFEKLQILSLSYIGDRSPGMLMNRISRDPSRIREFVSDTFCNAFTVVILFPCVGIYMLVLNWKLALLAFLFVPVSVTLSAAFRNHVRRRYRMQGRKSDKVNNECVPKGSLSGRFGGRKPSTCCSV